MVETAIFVTVQEYILEVKFCLRGFCFGLLGFGLVFFFKYTFERFLGEWGMVLNRTAEVLQLFTKGPPCSVQTFAYNLSFLIMGVRILEAVHKKRISKNLTILSENLI